MKFIPILFSTEMVQAILAGRKTMTRRIIKPQPIIDKESGLVFDGNNKRSPFDIHNWLEPFVDSFSRWLPGDVLWVREIFNPGYAGYGGSILYKANEWSGNKYKVKWKPSIHMPKTACRLFLKIKSISVERLQDISEEDAITEGLEIINGQFKNYWNSSDRLPTWKYARQSFKTLWQKINDAESWDINPWVWVIDFERIEKPENFK